MLRALLKWNIVGEQHSIRKPLHDVQIPVRIITHNIRYATTSPGENEKPWEIRMPLLMNELSYHTRNLDGRNTADPAEVPSRHDSVVHPTSFICLQEVLHNQLRDVLTHLNSDSDSKSSPRLGAKHLPSGPHWAHIGVGREDGKTKGEYSPILYPVHLFELLHFETTWLSPTPHKPSKGWDAGSERILTTGVFKHKATGQRIAIFNTHLDNAGPESRKESVAVILEIIECVRKQWSPRGSDKEYSSDVEPTLNFVLAGDFNSFPTQEAYRAVIASGKMIDTHDYVPKSRRYGNEITFTGFQPDTDEDKDEKGRIDFVFFGPRSAVSQVDYADQSQERRPNWRITGYSVLPNVFDDGIFCSDHRAVVADALHLA